MNDKCPNCGSDNTFFNGTLHECINCWYEWIGTSPEGISAEKIEECIQEMNDREASLSGY